MNRVFSAAVLALLVFWATAWGQKEEKEKVTFRGLLKEYLTKYEAAEEEGDAAAKSKLVDEYGPQFIALAEAAKGKETVDPIRMVVQLSVEGKRPEWREKAAELVRTQVKAAGVADHFTTIGLISVSMTGVAVLKEVLEVNPDKVVRAKAAKTLVLAYSSLDHQAKILDDKKIVGDEKRKVRKHFSDQYGEVHVKYLEANTKTFIEEGAKYQKLLNTEFAGVVPNPAVGTPAPETVSKGLDGKEVKLSDYKGKVVVLDFWNTKCAPCVAMIPHEQDLVKRLKDQPFALISVSVDDSVEVLKEFLKDTEMPWIHWFSSGKDRKKLTEDWDIQEYPAIYVIDHKGVIRFTGVRGKHMDTAVDQLLKEMEDDKKNRK